MKYTDIHREIVESCKNGDRRAQEKLYQLYSRAMYNICIRMIGDEDEAADQLQNSFIDVFTRLDSFRFESSIGAWIKRIVVNNCINFLKRRRPELKEIGEMEIPDFQDDPVDYEDTLLNVDRIKRAIPLLPDGYRVVFSLYLLEGYDHQEIGEIMGITESTSKSQLNRAKKKLRDIILNEFENDLSDARPA